MCCPRRPLRARSTSANFDFGQLFFRLRPIRLRPNSTSANFDFGQFLDVKFLDHKGWGPQRVEARGPNPEKVGPRKVEPEGWRPKPGKSGAPKVGAPKVGAPKGGAPKGGAPKGGAPKGGAPKGGRPKISRFFPFPATIFLEKGGREGEVRLGLKAQFCFQAHQEKARRVEVRRHGAGNTGWGANR